MAPEMAETGATPIQPSTSHSHGGLKKFASKPLKMAASTFRPLVSSRASTPLTHPAHSPSETTGGESESVSIASASTSRRNRMGRKKRHHHLQALGQAQGMSPAQIAAIAQGPRKPLDGEEPAAVLRVRVVKAEGLVAKDRNGTSDPFIILNVPPSGKSQTPVVKKSLNPAWPADVSTFDFPLYLSMAGVVGGRGIEGVMWDKDLMRKEYMGEIAIPCIDWFNGGDVKLWDENLALLDRSILSTRRKQTVSGKVFFQIGFLAPPESTNAEDALKRAKRIYSVFVDQATVGRGVSSVLGVPATQGIGTVKMRRDSDLAKSQVRKSRSPFARFRSSMHSAASPLAGDHQMQPVDFPADGCEEDEESSDDIIDDGLSSSSSDEDDDIHELDEDGFRDSPADMDGLNNQMYNSTLGFPGRKPSESGPKLSVPGKDSKTSGKQAPGSACYFDLPPSHKDNPLETASTGFSAAETPAMTPSEGKRKMFKRNKSKRPSTGTGKKKTNDFNFDARHGKEVLGIVIMEISGAEDLPRLKSSLRVTYDMDPFVVVSFGKKVFRTRVIRHSLNPTWDEKLLFHVRKHEATYTTQFTVLDWDKVSGNDLVGSCTLPLSELLADAPRPNPETGLYAEGEDGKHEMKQFTLPLVVDKDQPWESKYSPKLTIRAKYEPYDALRQRFWRQYMAQYDADETRTMSYTELTAMLDSLGSTLTKQTIEGYFLSCGKPPDNGELTFEEVVKCLEGEVTKDRSEKAKVTNKGDELSETAVGTPAIDAPPMQPEPAGDGLAFKGPEGGGISSPVDANDLAAHIIKARPRDADGTHGPGNQRSLSNDVPSVKVDRSATMRNDEVAGPAHDDSGMLTPASVVSETETDADISSPGDDRERVINIRTCPLCHRPRLSKRSEQDIITHLAICASADWERVDRIVTANYVTSSQAQRKFFTKLVNKVAIGAYSLGANSANILVQDRLTGQLQEEKMAVYVRLGIRVLYKGAKSRMEGARARKLLKSLSVKQGLKYDSPASAADIPAFIAFHNLPVDEILDPIDSFKTFNEFFYRKLKPSARPVESPGDERRMVSCADCRMMAFESVNEATNIWIKGREFTVGRLLGPEYKDVAHRFEGGALGIFRLAPQDYHRFHSPVKGKIGKMTLIDGEYYAVNPQAIRTSLDVYGENVRKIVPIETEDFGTVMTVWVGAMMVGSILTTVTEGQEVERADELGYFAFGGSTIICLFEKGTLKWDDDLLQNGRASIETLVRMGSGLGYSTRT